MGKHSYISSNGATLDEVCGSLMARYSCQAVTGSKEGVCLDEDSMTVVPKLSLTSVRPQRLEYRSLKLEVLRPLSELNFDVEKSGIFHFTGANQEIVKTKYLANNTQSGGEVTLHYDESDSSHLMASASGYLFNISWAKSIQLKCREL